MTDVPPHTRWPILYRTAPRRVARLRSSDHGPQLRSMGGGAGYLVICHGVDAVFTADTPEDAVAKWEAYAASRANI